MDANRPGVSLAEAARRLKPRWRDPDLPSVILVTDGDRLDDDPAAAVARLPRGAAVVLRHYRYPERRRLATRLAVMCRRRGIRLLIAGDPRLAVAVGAAGVHLPEAMVGTLAGRGSRQRQPRWLVTAAAHSPGAMRRAAFAGADAVLVSPVFATASHPDATPIGPLRFAAMVRTSPLPVYALGGITQATARRLGGSGACGFAAVGIFAGRC